VILAETGRFELPSHVQLVFFAGRRRGQVLMYLDTLLGVLLDSAKRVYEFLGSELSAKYDAKRALQDLRETITAEIRARA